MSGLTYSQLDLKVRSLSKDLHDEQQKRYRLQAENKRLATAIRTGRRLYEENKPTFMLECWDEALKGEKEAVQE